jgi:hypothetical protein
MYYDKKNRKFFLDSYGGTKHFTDQLDKLGLEYTLTNMMGSNSFYCTRIEVDKPRGKGANSKIDALYNLT